MCFQRVFKHLESVCVLHLIIRGKQLGSDKYVWPPTVAFWAKSSELKQQYVLPMTKRGVEVRVEDLEELDPDRYVEVPCDAWPTSLLDGSFKSEIIVEMRTSDCQTTLQF